ncbi:hypothetical protein HPB51_018111 [Rhipicephalus microplus]|uniref:Uncharacterized protein n=1 Tax=Rhipicephalus microplus TaxID=6941 RepID=A0A9J6E2L5_RHIMP|nr:hypothetical protein HPB51_018111 [Rhipicephalus microplus]
MSDPRQSPDNAGSPQPSSPSITPDNVQENNVGGTTPATETTTVFSSPMDQILIFGHGRFQKRVLFCTALAFFAAVTHVRTPAILARPVDHWCKPPTDYAYMTVGEWKNASVPLEADDKTRSACLRYDPPLPYSEDFENRTEVPCDAGWDYDAGAVGAPLAGVAADAIGRRPVLCTCIFLVMFSGVSLAFARTVLAFAVLRVLLSASVSSVLVTSLVLLFEVTDTQHRALFCSLAMASPFFTAALYFELVYSLELSWYASQIAFMVPTGVLVLAVYMMDESPCWLLAVSNKRRAVQVLSWAARVNEVDPDVFNERLSELKAGLRKQREPQQASTPTDVSSPEREVHAMDLVIDQRLRKRTAVMLGCWFLSYAVFNLTTLRHGALSVLSLAQALIHVLRAPDHLLAGVVVSSMLVFDMCLIALYLFSAELYPTVVRVTGLAFGYASGRLGTARVHLRRRHQPGRTQGSSLRRGSRAAAVLGRDGDGAAGDHSAAAGQHDA